MSWRRIDVDALDEDRVSESDFYPAQDAATLDAFVSGLAQETRSRGEGAAVLHKVLAQVPYGNVGASTRDKYLDIVMGVLQSTKQSDIPNAIKDLAPAEMDALMSCIYKGMAHPSKYNSGNLLQWHDRLTQLAGVGSIVRVLTDKRGF